MILPSKHIPLERSLLAIGGEVVRTLDRPQTVSSLWETFRMSKARSHVSYEWFVLSLDFLYLCGAVDFQNGLLRRTVS
jgi:hypothetical protein